MAGSKITRSPTRWSLEKEVGDLYAVVTIGGTGAVSAVKGGGISGVVKESTAGQYTLTTEATWNRLLEISASVVHGSISGVAAVQVLEAAATLQSNYKADRSITLQCLDYAGAAVNPPSGSNLIVRLSVRESTSAVFD